MHFCTLHKHHRHKRYVVSYSPPKYSSMKPRWLDAAAASCKTYTHHLHHKHTDMRSSWPRLYWSTAHNHHHHPVLINVAVVLIITMKEWANEASTKYTQDASFYATTLSAAMPPPLPPPSRPVSMQDQILDSLIRTSSATAICIQHTRRYQQLKIFTQISSQSPFKFLPCN